MSDRGRRFSYPGAAVAVSLVGAIALVAVGHEGPVGEPGVPAGPVMAAPGAAASQGSPTAEGIKVHGHWTIEVREADGALVERREFENVLTPFGAGHIVQVLARETVQDRWLIQLDGGGGSTGADQLCLRDGTPNRCVILESDADCFFQFQFCTLTIGVEADPALLLSGTVTAQRTGRIIQVWTSTSAGIFTATSIDPIDVLEGQQVLVNVRISFS